MISEILFFSHVHRQYGHLLSLDLSLPERKLTTITTDKDIFKYFSQTTSDLFGFEKKLLNSD